MSTIAITGANGFLGWHTRAALLESGADIVTIALGERFDLSRAVAALNGASRLIHIAGANRGQDNDIRELNELFAIQISQALLSAENPPAVVVYANSTQATNGTVYGMAKAAASAILERACVQVHSKFENVLLPNLFGEHGRPFYNSVTATFSHLIATKQTPSIDIDKQLDLLHAQDAADILLGAVRISDMPTLVVSETVAGLLGRLVAMADIYDRGEIPDIASKFNRDLFNTYRSFTFPAHSPVRLTRHADSRGSFFEVVRSHGGEGQSSFSTTAPGISRGDHYHRRKVERFTVLSGRATISLRRLFTTEVLEFSVQGDEPAAIDMPTMWSHKITNTGTDVLYTSFWANEIFDPSSPDTIAEAVSA